MNRDSLVEINFDGIVGPSHNYAGLSLGNLAATAHAGTASYPRAAALQGLTVNAGGMINDLHGTPEYRAALVKVLTGRAVTAAG